MFVTRFIAFLILLSGILNIVSSFVSYPLSRLSFLRHFFPVEFLRTSRTSTLLLGFFLIFLARGLVERKFRSWTIAIFLLAASIITNMLKALDYEESLLLLIPLLLLLRYRFLFVVKSGRIELIHSLKISLYLLIAIIIYAFLGYFVLRYYYEQPLTLNSILSDYTYSLFGMGTDTLVSLSLQTRVFEATVKYASLFSVIIFFAALYAPLTDKKKPTEKELLLARRLVLKSGKNSTCYFNLMGDKSYFFLNEKSFLAYKVKNGCAVVLGDPIGEKHYFLKCIQSFIQKVTLQGLSVAFYNVSEENLSLYKKLGYQSLKIGEEAVIETGKFNLEGSSMKDVRYGFNKMQREGVIYKWFSMDNLPFQMLDEINKLHDNWLQDKSAPKLSYSLDYFPFPLEAKAFILLSFDSENKLLGCFSYFPYNRDQCLVIDVILRNLKSPNGLIEAMLAESIFHFKNLGYKEINLSIAPFSNVRDSKNKLLDRGTKLIFEKVNAFYKYRTLFNFKKKFFPIWRSKYLIYQSIVILPKVTLALVQVHLQQSPSNSLKLEQIYESAKARL